jgi:hypothetical protein
MDKIKPTLRNTIRSMLDGLLPKSVLKGHGNVFVHHSWRNERKALLIPLSAGPARRVIKASTTSLRLIKNVLGTVKRDLGNNPLNSELY